MGAGVNINGSASPAGVSGGASANVDGASVSVDAAGNVTTTGLDTSPDATSGRVDAGASATLDLAEHGFDPNNTGDQQKLVSAIAGAACLIPAVGPVCGAVVEALYQGGRFIAQGLCKLGVFDCREYCHSTGNWTTTDFPPPPGLAKGSPQAALWPLVSEVLASYLNCKPNIALGGLYQGFTHLWDTLHDGSSTVTFAVYSPAAVSLDQVGGFGAADPRWGVELNTPAGTGATGDPRFVWLTVNNGPLTAAGKAAMQRTVNLSAGAIARAFGRPRRPVVQLNAPAAVAAGRYLNAQRSSRTALLAAGGVALAGLAGLAAKLLL